jgi:hypothetical protein
LTQPEQLDDEMVRSVLTVYASLMALMTYGEIKNENPVVNFSEPASQSPVLENKNEKAVVNLQKQKKKKKGKSVSTKQSITYILRSSPNGSLRVTTQGSHSHASPKGVFSVRGHFRHYKNGNVVWVAEYKKGTKGEKKGKNYKLNKNVEM